MARDRSSTSITTPVCIPCRSSLKTATLPSVRRSSSFIAPSRKPSHARPESPTASHRSRAARSCRAVEEEYAGSNCAHCNHYIHRPCERIEPRQRQEEVGTAERLIDKSLDGQPAASIEFRDATADRGGP